MFDSCSDAKSYISSMDVFIGARMHATIAAYSSYVPVIPFAYSRKFEGLYNSIGYNYILDGKKMTTDECIKKSIEWIKNKEKLMESIEEGHKIIDTKIEIFKKELEKIIFEKND